MLLVNIINFYVNNIDFYVGAWREFLGIFWGGNYIMDYGDFTWILTLSLLDITSRIRINNAFTLQSATFER